MNLQGHVKIYAKNKEGRIVKASKANTLTYDARNVMARMVAQSYSNNVGSSPKELRIGPSHLTLIGDGVAASSPRGDNAASMLTNIIQKSAMAGGGDSTIDFTLPTQDVAPGATVRDIHSTVSVTQSPISGSVDSDFAEVKITIEIDPDTLDTTTPIHQIAIWSAEPGSTPTTEWDIPRVFSVATLASDITIDPSLYYSVIYTYKFR